MDKWMILKLFQSTSEEASNVHTIGNVCVLFCLFILISRLTVLLSSSFWLQYRCYYHYKSLPSTENIKENLCYVTSSFVRAQSFVIYSWTYTYLICKISERVTLTCKWLLGILGSPLPLKNWVTAREELVSKKQKFLIVVLPQKKGLN